MLFRDIFRVFFHSTSGKVGIAFLVMLFAISLYVIIAYPLDYGKRTWYNPVVWADLPKNAPPAWVPGQHFRHRLFESEEPAQIMPTGEGKIAFYTFPFRYDGGQLPSFLSLTVEDVVYYKEPPVMALFMRRPDGHDVLLYQFVVPAPHPGETPPIHRYADTPQRVLLSTNEVVLTRVAEFLSREFGFVVRPSELQGRLEQALFGVPSRETTTGFRPVSGTYTMVLTATLNEPRDRIGKVRMALGGTSYGFMGTDNLGRDLAEGLLFGFPVALVIGIVTALFTTFIGSSLGIISGYSGGRTDTLIQRLADIVSNIPLLPILIFLMFVLGSRLWLVILLLIAFSWPGLTILTRSMVLQMRTGQLVEAAQAMGASTWRIMFRHIAFQIAPYLLAQMIFFTPGAILAEAALSFLGLGDATLPTWGQILEQGFRTGAVYLGYWWWVVPPGLLIVATAMTFVFITLGLEPVVNPRLRGAR